MNKENKNSMVVKCLLCGKEVNLQFKGLKGYKAPDLFDIYHCKHCNTSFSLPRVEDTGDIYNLIYNHALKKQLDIYDYGRYERFARDVKTMDDPLDYLAFTEVVYWGVAECLKNIDKTSNILEVGCGLGYLTYAMRKSGYNAFGLDISQEAIERNKQQLGNFYVCGNIYDYAVNHSHKYDVIVLTELIEHINEPFSFVETLIGMLNPGGSIILTTPNKSFYPQNAIWLTDLPPVHGWWFSEDSFKYIAEQMDLEVSFVDFESFYRNHKKDHYDMENMDLVSSGFVFDEKGNFVPCIMEQRNHGMIPLFFKSTKQYSRLKNSSFYRYLNGVYATFKNRQLEKTNVCSKHRTFVLCACLKKK